ncbi:MAG TPA: leucyl aminopeptidase [Candidatus Angelobacter sp.]
METKSIVSSPSDVETECLVVFALDHGQKQQNDARLTSRDAALERAAAELLTSGEVTCKTFEAAMVHRPPGLRAKRLLVINAGKAKTFGALELRKAAGTAVRFLKAKMIKNCAFILPDSGNAEDAIRCIVENAFVADFDPDTYRSERKDLRMKEISIVIPPAADRVAAQHAIDQATIIGESQNFARELVNEPSNRLTPTVLADRARAMCETVGLNCEIMGPEKIKALKMGAFWSVAQGSDEEPRLIIVRYEPAGAPEKPMLGLVGKGITFDTGGISIKPSEGMEKMKYDMAGGAAMLGAMRAIALLKPRVKVIGIVCATENMPSGKAQKPGDIQIAMSGKAIEIINTDAEGRLVLADGLHYARTLGCTHLADAATLTGACVVALGMVNAGIFANNEEIYQRFCKALERSGEKFWRLPLDQEYFEQIRSSIADIMNTGGRYGGAINAAMFLKEFVEDTPWIHLDIAGVAWMEENKSWIAKGPSGIAVRSLVEWVGSYSS